jgi:hypothetical protein
MVGDDDSDPTGTVLYLTRCKRPQEEAQHRRNNMTLKKVDFTETHSTAGTCPVRRFLLNGVTNSATLHKSD